MVAFLIDTAIKHAISKVFVDPNNTITFSGAFTMPPTYHAGTRTIQETKQKMHPEYILDAIENVLKALPANDAQRNKLIRSLQSIEIPANAGYCISSRDEENDFFTNGVPDYPVIPMREIDDFNRHLERARQKLDNVRALLLPPEYQEFPRDDEPVLPPYHAMQQSGLSRTCRSNPGSHPKSKARELFPTLAPLNSRHSFA